MGGKKYDYFDEQNDQIKQDQKQITQQMEQMAKDQAKEALKRAKNAGRRMADIAEKEAAAGEVGGAVAGGGSGAVAGGASAAGGAGGASAAGAGTAAGGGASSVGAGAGGASAAGAGTAAGGGIAYAWWIILIIIIVVIIVIIVFAIINAVNSSSRQIEEVEPAAANVSVPLDERKVNNAQYILELVQNGDISLETSASGAFDNDYAVEVLEAVVEEKEARGQHISVSYERQPWVLVEDKNGNTLDDMIDEINKNGGKASLSDYYVKKNGKQYKNSYGTWQECTMKNAKLHTTLSRKDVESSSFQVDYFADPYELRWQPVYVLCAMRITGVVNSWGLAELDADGKPVELTVEKMNSDGVADYFLKSADIKTCIECFQPKFRYIWNPLETVSDGAEFEFDDDKMKVYMVEDERENANIRVGQRAYVNRIPTVAASSIDLGYRRITYQPEAVNGEPVIKYRTIQETPEEWLEKLNVAAGGYFDQNLFLYLLEQLPGTEDLVDEYRKIFASTDKTYNDYSKGGCIGAHIREAKVNSGGQVMWMAFGDIDTSQNVLLYLHNDHKKFQFKKFPDEVDTFEIVVNSMAYSRPAIIQNDAERMTRAQVESQLKTYCGGYFANDADAFLKMQDVHNISIPACMALFKQEGGYHIPTGKQGWNYGNVKASAEEINNGTAIDYADSKWANFKERYKNVNFQAEGFSSLHTYCVYKSLSEGTTMSYLKRKSFADMSLRANVNGVKGPMPPNTIIDCGTQMHGMNYCPPCDDNGLTADGITSDGYGRMVNGWVNGINKTREQIERSYGYDVYTMGW